MAGKVAKVEGGTRQRYITLKKFYRFAEDLHLNTHTERDIRFPGKAVDPRISRSVLFHSSWR